MLKAQAVEKLGEKQLLLPAWIKAALTANDRLKAYLTILQAAQSHAENPGAPSANLSRELASAGVAEKWLSALVDSAVLIEDGGLHAQGSAELRERFRDDLLLMARPIAETDARNELLPRVEAWRVELEGQAGEGFSPQQLIALTSGRRESASFHVLVMDLHKALNALAASLANEIIDGAHVWQLAESDRPRVSAFMRGLNRTARLKFDHPGLDAAATSDNGRLLLQNDIGTNDAHVLVIQVEGHKISLTYSDLHARRFSFFVRALEEAGAEWSKQGALRSDVLNEGEAYRVGVAEFQCPSEDALQAALENIGARIVFLIDWNRARKRLNQFVDKEAAVSILDEAARAECGHMGWLLAGGDRLVFDLMQSLGPDQFRIGDRLDAVMGGEDAKTFLIDLLKLCCDGWLEGQPPRRIAEQGRTLLSQRMRRRADALDHVTEHAAYCHAIATGLAEGLARNIEADESAALALSERSKAWERSADALVNKARERSGRQAEASAFTRLIETADDVADALEEAAFNLALIAQSRDLWDSESAAAIQALAGAVLDGVQDYVRALSIAHYASPDAPPEDEEDFQRVIWRIVDAEQRCDLLMRNVKRAVVQSAKGCLASVLFLDFASALELASDNLLRTSYRLKETIAPRFGAFQ